MADKAKYLYDDFTTFNTSTWWRSEPGQGVVTGGQMQLIPTNAYDYVSTVEYWDLKDSYVSFKLVQNASEGLGSVGTSFTVGPDWSNNVEFEIDGGASGVAKVRCHELVEDVYDTTQFTYDSSQPWFRIRESLGTIYWETSADGNTWTIRRSKESVLDLTESDVRMSAFFWDAETDPGVALIDDLNLHAGIPGRPKTETLVDTFDIASPQWLYEDAEGDENQVINGQLHMLSTETNYSPLYATNTYDLTDSFFSIQLVQTNPPGNGTFLNEVFVGTDLDNCVYIQFAEEGSWIQFVERIGGVNTSGGPIQLDTARHKYFRIRESGGTVYWDTSIDSEYWVNRWSKVTALDLTDSRIRIYCAPYGTEDPATVIWDNVNVVQGNTIGPEIPFKAELFQDDYSEDTGAWYGAEGILWVDGTLQCSPTDEYQWQVSNDEWDLTDSHAMWEMVQNALAGTSGWDGNGTTSTELIVTCQDPELPNTGIRFAIFGGDAGIVKCQIRIEGVDDDITFTYDPIECRYFRMREGSGTAYWETSPNSITWTVRRSSVVPEEVDLGRVKFGLSIGYWDTEAEFGPNGTVILDNFNTQDVSLQSAIAWGRSDLALGGRKTGTVEARNYFQAADWHWEPIPENPVLDDRSEMIGHWLHLPDVVPQPNHSVATIRYANGMVHPNQIDSDTPRYHVNYLGPIRYPSWWGDETEMYEGAYEYAVPIPYGTQIPPGSDAHLVVADPYYGKVFSFWQASYDADLDEWSASSGGIAELDGDGRDYGGGSTATNISRYSCIPRIGELQAGEIPHALFVISNMCSVGGKDEFGEWQGFRYPAQKSDGAGHPDVPEAAWIDQGSRVQLDPSIDLGAIPNISPAELAVGRCWQKYGAYVADKGGNPWPPFISSGGAGELWQGQEYPPYPFGPGSLEDDVYQFPDFELDDLPYPPVYAAIGFSWDYFGLTKIPWQGNMRVLKHWHGGNSL